MTQGPEDQLSVNWYAINECFLIEWLEGLGVEYVDQAMLALYHLSCDPDSQVALIGIQYEGGEAQHG